MEECSSFGMPYLDRHSLRETVGHTAVPLSYTCESLIHTLFLSLSPSLEKNAGVHDRPQRAPSLPGVGGGHGAPSGGGPAPGADPLLRACLARHLTGHQQRPCPGGQPRLGQEQPGLLLLGGGLVGAGVPPVRVPGAHRPAAGPAHRALGARLPAQRPQVHGREALSCSSLSA